MRSLATYMWKVFSGLTAIKVEVDKPSNIDGAINVAQINSVAVYKQDKYRDDLLWDTYTTGTGTAVYEGANGGIKMSVSANNDVVIRQTKQFHIYYSGSPQFIEATFINISPVVNVEKRVGYFSTVGSVAPYNTNRDGCYLYSNSTAIYFKIDKAGVNIFSMAQSGWDDPMDGTGESGITLASSTFNALVIEFLYLGGTIARFGFLINDQIVWCHTFLNANVLSSTFMASPVQPVRYEIRSTGGTSNLYQNCARVGSKGAANILPYDLDFSPTSFINANTLSTVYALVGVKMTDIRAVISVAKIYADALTNDRFKITLRRNPTVAGTFTYNAVTGLGYSIALGDAAGNPSTNTVTNGDVIVNVSADSQDNILLSVENRALVLGSLLTSVSDTLVLCVEPLSANLDMTGTLTVREFI